MERDLARALHRTRTLIWRARFVVAAGCCGLAAAVAVDALRPPPPPVEHVVVTAREVPAGASITASDVATTAVAADLMPAGLVTDVDELVGRTAAVALPAGVPLHRGLVPADAVRAPAGRVVVAVRVTEPGWLRPGDRVDLLAGQGDDGGSRLARRALVLPPQEGPGSGGSSGGLLQGTGPAADAPPTLVAVDPDEAAAVSAASGGRTVVAVLVP